MRGAAAADTLHADYLIVGSGAIGMAFADVLFHETSKTLLLVDRHDAPGGHWNDAYPFVRLHSPSAFYGVNSTELGPAGESPPADRFGHMATASEIVAYFQKVMDKMTESGRVRYLPKADYVGDFEDSHTVRSLVANSTWNVVAGKVVDTTFQQTEVPSTRPPAYAVAEGVRCMPPNDLVSISDAPDGYVIIGAGKTAIDACLWLLEHDVEPSAITWVRPRDPMLVNRATAQTFSEHFDVVFEARARQMEIAAEATSIEDLVERLTEAGVLLQLDPTVAPQAYRGATVSEAEIASLRSVTNVVRLGRVLRIEADEIVLEGGVVATPPNLVYVDCTARGVATKPPVPIWDGPRITPHFVRSVRPTFAAAFIAHLEACIPDDHTKNELCVPIPLSGRPSGWAAQVLGELRNRNAWREHPALEEWITNSRLDRNAALAATYGQTTSERTELMQRFAAAVAPAFDNLARIIAAERSSPTPPRIARYEDAGTRADPVPVRPFSKECP